jgi:hypothetical protein
MVKEQPERRRSRFAICREWLCWALLALVIVGFWVFLGRTAYLWFKGFF